MQTKGRVKMAGTRGRLQIIIAGTVGIAFLMEQLDATIITTATPRIAAALHTSPLYISLAITSYLLTLVTAMPLSFWLAGRFGAARVFCAALGLFTAASAGCGLAESLPTLLAMRMLQGLGGGLMTPVGRAILIRAFPRSQLVKAMTWFNIPIVIGPTLGPVLGGIITTYASWHWIFFVNLPFGLAGIWAARRYVPNLRQDQTARFDGSGYLLAAAALILLQAAVQVLSLNVLSLWLVAGLLAGCAVFTLAYARHARRRKHPVLDFSLLRIRGFGVGVLAGGLSRVGINGIPYLLPLLLQVGFGKSPLETGMLVAVTCLGIVLVRPAAAPLLRRFGFGRLLAGNCMLGALSILTFAALGAQTPDGVILLVILGFSLMRGMQFATLNTISYADMPRESLSQSTSLGGIAQQLTMGLGVAVSVALLNLFAGAGATLTPLAFRGTFIVLAAITLLAAPGFRALRLSDGAGAIPALPMRPIRPGSRPQPAYIAE
jgi:EmrB/QacA subfamily drug resistance transporter